MCGKILICHICGSSRFEVYAGDGDEPDLIKLFRPREGVVYEVVSEVETTYCEYCGSENSDWVFEVDDDVFEEFSKLVEREENVRDENELRKVYMEKLMVVLNVIYNRKVREDPSEIEAFLDSVINECVYLSLIHI